MSQTNPLPTCPNPKCGKPIPITYTGPWCNVCGYTLGKDIQNQLIELRRANEQAVTSSQQAAAIRQDPFAEASNQVRAVTTRYLDAYRVARTTIGLGKTIKAAGIVLAFLILGIAAVLVASAISQSSQGGPGSQAGLFLGAAVIVGVSGVFAGGLVHLLGILISALGQILQASLDGTVNTSPFLTNEDKARVMSLPVG